MNLLISLCDTYDAEGRTLCCVQNEHARKGIPLINLYLWMDVMLELFNKVTLDVFMRWILVRRFFLIHKLAFLALNAFRAPKAPWGTKSQFPCHEMHLQPWNEDSDFRVNRIKLQYHHHVHLQHFGQNAPLSRLLVSILWQRCNFLHEMGLCENCWTFHARHVSHATTKGLPRRLVCIKIDLMSLNSCMKFHDKK